MKSTNIIIYSYWRTGSNLLASIFQVYHNYFYLNDWHVPIIQRPADAGLIAPGGLVPYSNITNDYLYTLLSTDYNHTVLKVNLPHIEYIDTKIKSQVMHNLFLYRSNFFEVGISKCVAEKRKIWAARHDDPTELVFSGRIDPALFREEITRLVDAFRSFLNKIPRVNYVVNYETDLVPYIRENPTYFKKIPTYDISNIDELTSLFENEFSSQVNTLVNTMDMLRGSINRVPFAEKIKQITQ